MRFKAEFYSNFKENILPIVLKFIFEVLEIEEALSNSFYEAIILLISQPINNTTKRYIYFNNPKYKGYKNSQ